MFENYRKKNYINFICFCFCFILWLFKPHSSYVCTHWLWFLVSYSYHFSSPKMIGNYCSWNTLCMVHEQSCAFFRMQFHHRILTMQNDGSWTIQDVDCWTLNIELCVLCWRMSEVYLHVMYSPMNIVIKFICFTWHGCNLICSFKLSESKLH